MRKSLAGEPSALKDRRQALARAVQFMLLAPGSALAQGDAGLRRIAYLGTSARSQHLMDAFLARLPDHGWLIGKNVAFDARYTEGDPARVPAQTRELLALKPTVFVAATDTAALDAARAPGGVPIVFVLGFDPVGLDLVKDLGAPGGRCTGFSVLNWELNPKRLALLKEAVPRLERVGMLYRRSDPNASAALGVVEKAARDLRIDVLPSPIDGPDDFAPAFKRMAQLGVKGVLNIPDSLFFKWRQRLAELAFQHQLAAMFGATEFADAGMLLAYGTDFKAVFARAAGLVDRILKGANPATIPVEQVSTYELVINLRTARNLGIDLPRSLILQATRVIE
jgi:putative ABC transport system substrate-binding protein